MYTHEYIYQLRIEHDEKENHHKEIEAFKSKL